jgi:hypothetical protein
MQHRQAIFFARRMVPDREYQDNFYITPLPIKYCITTGARRHLSLRALAGSAHTRHEKIFSCGDKVTQQTG